MTTGDRAMDITEKDQYCRIQQFWSIFGHNGKTDNAEFGKKMEIT